MKNLSNYINERLVLSKDNDNTLSRVNLEPGQFIMRVSDFYAWYCRKRSFDDISIKFIEDHNIWADLVDNGTFKNIQEVRDFIKDFADDDEDYVVAEQEELPNVYEINFELDDVRFSEDCTDPVPDSIIIRKN